MSPVRLLAPRDLAGLAAALGQASPGTRLVAGGTDLLLAMRGSGFRPDLLIDLSGLRELSFVAAGPDLIRIGALTTFSQIERDATLARLAPCLALAAAHVGSAQIRNVATIGGNVANASPCADAIPALLVLGASAGVMNCRGEVERRPLQDLLARVGGATVPFGEAIVDFSFAPPSEGHRSAFAKVGARSSVAVAKLNAAMLVRFDGNTRAIVGARVAFGSVAPVAGIDASVAVTLCGRPLSGSTVEAFADACAAMVGRLIPDRASLPYKRHAVRGLAFDLCAAIEAALPD